jgi:glycosyltransferase involved in cell wall biosynthesis
MGSLSYGRPANAVAPTVGASAAPLSGRAAATARPVRVAHLVSHPIQYYAPLYRELATRAEIDLTVYYCSAAGVREFYDPGFGRAVRWDTPLLDGYRSRFCPSAERARVDAGWRGWPNWDVVREIVRGRYDVVWLHGYNHPTSLLAALGARLSGARLLIREDQTLLDRRSWWKRAAKMAILRVLFSQATGLYVGAQNRRYFVHYGMPAYRLFAAPHCIDNQMFRERAAAVAGERHAIRARWGITDDAPVVLFCGKLIEKKQPLVLVEAYSRARRERPCWLLLVGDGAQRAAVEERVRRQQIPGVVVAGFLNQSELPAAYAAAEILVLPSAWHETWGLVVNEAMNFALPIVVSDKVGCAEDLVRPGWNGFIVPHGDVAALAHAMATLVADAQIRAVFGARSRALVDEYNVERCAAGIVAACLDGQRQEGIRR